MFNYDRQNYWQLAVIQGSALGLPGILIGHKLVNQFGPGATLLAICIGNLILWGLGLVMISMTYKENQHIGHSKHALENVKSYLGKYATSAASAVLALAFLSWFTVQLRTDMATSNTLMQNHPDWSLKSSLEIMASLAIITTFLSMGGIKVIKWICTISFPLFFIFLLYAIFTERPSTISFNIEWRSLFAATMVVIIVVLPGIINLPTFFRHARSRPDAILALTLMTIFVAVFQFGSLWLNFSDSASVLFKPYSAHTGWTINLVLVLGFITITTLCINLVNIYFASAVLEIIKPKFADARGYVIIGLIGTLSFGLMQSLSVMEYIQQLTNCIIGCLGITLLMGYLATMMTKHRSRPLEQHVNAGCWFLGSLISIWEFYIHKTQVPAFITGISVTAFAFILVLFYEEIHSCIKSIKNKKLSY